MSTPPPNDLEVSFVDHYTPHATAGIYTVGVRQELFTDTGERIDTDGMEIPESVQRFEIRPIRFVLHHDSVHTVYPPDGSAGRYDTVLPHITLTRAILPWERELTSTRVREHAPWLALLVFREGELPHDPQAGGATTTRSVAALITQDEHVRGPGLAGSPSLTPEILAGDCQTVDVPAKVFQQVVPLEEELYYLAHVRDVTDNTQRADNEDLVEGQYAVVVANRFARDPGRYCVHLVSLEGHEPLTSPDPPTGHEFVRLCVLWSWAFHHDPDNHLDTAGLLSNLAAPSLVDPDNLALRMPPPRSTRTDDPAEAYAHERLRLGYVPVASRTLSGETTYAWYRGPLTPLVAAPVPDPGLATGHTTADHALIYEEEHGVFDVSYASAWTLGRTLGLADPDYAAEITRARREIGNRAAELSKIAADPARAGSLDTRRGLRALRELAETANGRVLAQAFTAPVPERGPEPRQQVARVETHALLTDERAVSALARTARDHAEPLAARLDELTLLSGIPFAYLVPDSRMLPPESMRLFRIDAAWIQAVAAGAADVGLHTERDLLLDGQIRSAVARVRAAAVPVAGLLIRSALLRAWPEIGVTCYDGDTVLTESRRATPAEDVLLCLYDEVPNRVELREPAQGIHFGIDHGGVIGLRSLGDPGDEPLGENTGAFYPEPVPDDEPIARRFLRPVVRGGTPSVLVLRGAEGLVSGLAGELSREDLTPSQFALQLVNAPLLQELRPLDGSL